MPLPEKIAKLAEELHKEVSKHENVHILGIVVNLNDGHSLNMVYGAPQMLMELCHFMARDVKRSILKDLADNPDAPADLSAMAKENLIKMDTEEADKVIRNPKKHGCGGDCHCHDKKDIGGLKKEEPLPPKDKLN